MTFSVPGTRNAVRLHGSIATIHKAYEAQSRFIRNFAHCDQISSTTNLNKVPTSVVERETGVAIANK